jgi:ADP-glucose pyrophosphorylase
MKLLLILLSSILLMACEPTIITKYRYIEAVKPTDPAPLNLASPYFYVVSDANLQEFIEQIKKENNGVFFAITPDSYEIMAENTQEFRRYIKQCRQVNSYYQGLLSAGQLESDE